MSLFKNMLQSLRWHFAQRQEDIIKEYRRLGVHIGENCDLQKGIHFGSEPYLISIGDKVRINPGVQFVTHDGGVWILRNTGDLPNADIFGTIHIGNNVAIGHNATIMPGVSIGDNSIIALGAIVTKDVPNNSIVAGVPAHVIESYDEYLYKAKQKCDFTKHMTPKEKEQYLKAKFNI